MWRPTNWDKLALNLTYHNVSTQIYDKKEVGLAREFFRTGLEIGADAILEALKKEDEQDIAKE